MTNRPDAQFPAEYYRDDEISLVDLTLILVRRRWWVIGTGALVFGLALAYALLARDEASYQFTTIYQTAEYIDQAGEPRTMQPANGLIRQIETIYWPELAREFVDNAPELNNMPFALDVSNPSDTDYIVLSTVAAESQQEVVRDLHQQTLSPISQLQADRIESRKEAAGRQISRLQANMDRLNGAPDTPGEVLINYSDRIADLEAQIETLREGNIIRTAARGESQPNGPGTSMILALGIILGGILGLMAGFFAEFGAKVRQALNTAHN